MRPTVSPRPGRTNRLYNQGTGALTDDDWVRRLQLEASLGDLEGPAWRHIRDDVWVHCTKVLAAMIRDGRVWLAYRRLGGLAATDLRHPSGGVDRDDAHDLASDTIAGALPVLQHQLHNGRWQPDQGASIRTWTTNLAILRLPAIWRRWRRHLPAPAHPVDVDVDVDEGAAPDAVIFTLEFERSIDLLDGDLRPLVRLDCDGDTDAEIAAAAGLTTKQVEYRLKKARAQIRARYELERSRDRRRHAG